MSALSRVKAVVSITALSSLAAAQSPPPVRPIGRLLAASTEPMASVSQVRALPGGRVLVSDILSKRVLMFDSTFQQATVVVDTIRQFGALITYHGDSTLYADPAQVSMFVIDPGGKVVRTMAIPDPRGMLGFLGGPYGTPGLDAMGRLVYAVPPPRPTVEPAAGARSLGDSAPILRFNLESRARDTVTKIAVPPARYAIRTVRAGKDTSSMAWRATNPAPSTDDWAVLSDGTIVVVHGRDYRVDMIDVDGRVTSGPKLPFSWQRLSTEDKSGLLDSTRNAMAKREAELTADREAQTAAKAKADSIANPSASRRAPDRVAVTVTYPLVSVDDIPDYLPAFGQGAARGDADGNLWIRTSKYVDGGAVYDVIDRQGKLIDRVAVPQGRVIAGFGPGGVVYMGVLIGKVARLERALAPRR